MTTDTLTLHDGLVITPRNRMSMWRTAGAEIVALLAFVVITQLLLRIVDINPEGGAAIAISLLLAGIPAVLWMAIFYAQDRAEPEPLHSVLLVAGAAGLLAVAVGQPLITKAFGVNNWLGRSTWTQIIGAILVIGFIQEFCKFIAIRATVYESDAINQRVDGVVYGAAAGVGYATALNISAVLSAGGFVDLRAGVIRIVATALTHGALGALIGYAIGRNRVENRPAWSLPLVLAAAATINGLSYWLRQKVSARSISMTGTSGAQPARGLLLQGVIAVVLLVAVLALVRRADQRVIPIEERSKGNRGPLLAVVGLTGIALLLGLVQRNAVLGETKAASGAGARIAYPATWALSESPTQITARDLGAGGLDTTLSLRSIKIDPKLTDIEAITQVSALINVSRGTEKSGYKVFNLDAGRKLKGRSAATARYVFTSDRSSFVEESLPVVVTGDDTYVRNGDTIQVMTLETPVANRSDALPRYRRFVSSIRFTES
jgi:RsiW-degrading membrane proteinase PrsW (M82 family)